MDRMAAAFALDLRCALLPCQKGNFSSVKVPREFLGSSGPLEGRDVWLETTDGVRVHGWMIETDTGRGLVTLYQPARISRFSGLNIIRWPLHIASLVMMQATECP